MVSKEIGEDPDHPELCPRCAGIVKTYYQINHEAVRSFPNRF
ncbi:hypothetical protein PO124_01375 [Bacillus licheniformis]|nr:hypothetical protein [Bacillus licheniformis]